MPWRQLSKRFPDDHEATIFYALSLLGTAPPGDATYANQKKAAAILNGLLPRRAASIRASRTT